MPRCSTRKLTIDNVWYDTEEVVIDDSQVIVQDSIVIALNHKPASLALNVVPASEAQNVTVLINNENRGSVSANGTTMAFNSPGALQGAPPPEGTIESNRRFVELRATIPALNNFEIPLRTPTVEWFEPGTQERTITFPKGELVVESVPTASDVFIDEEMVGTTTHRDSLFATVSTPRKIQVRNDACQETDPELDQCTFSIPSSVRDVTIPPGDQKTEVFFLAPFQVRDQTTAGDIQVSLARIGDALTVSYTIESNKNRKYVVDFDMFDASGNKIETDEDQDGEIDGELDGEVVACTIFDDTAEASAMEAPTEACLGSGIRRGTYAFTWDLTKWGLEKDDAEHTLMPVLSLRKKSPCWPCVLIPAAAGVAAAYIWPRTGSNETPGGFVPPPRPSELRIHNHA